MPRSYPKSSAFPIMLGLAIVIAYPTHAQSTKSSDGPTRGVTIPGPRESHIPENGTVVEMLRFSNLPNVEAYLNGKGPYRFVVDTGAPLLCLNQSVADELKLPPPAHAGTASVRLGSPGGPGRPAEPREIESLRIGDAEFRGVRILASDSPFSNDFDGVIGLAVFQDCLLTFNYPAGKLRISQGELPPGDGSEILDYTLLRAKPVIPVLIDDRKFDFVLDTGASLWFKFPHEATQDCTYLFGPVEASKARTIDREIIINLARLPNILRVGRHVFERPYGVVDDVRDMASIGSGALDDFVLTVDQKNSRLRLARAGEDAIVPPPLRVVGFGMRRTQDGVKIDYVLPNSPARKAGLKEGDLVVALADRPVEEIHGRPIMKELVKQESIKVRYVPANETAEREIELKIFELIP